MHFCFPFSFFFFVVSLSRALSTLDWPVDKSVGDYFDYYDDKPTVCGGTTPLAERIIEWKKTSRVLT